MTTAKVLPSTKVKGTSVTKVGFNVRKDIASGTFDTDSPDYVAKVIALRAKTVVHGKKKWVENATYNDYLAFKLELADKNLPKIDKRSISAMQSKRRQTHARYRRVTRSGNVSVIVKELTKVK